jgi:hypothetical protein
MINNHGLIVMASSRRAVIPDFPLSATKSVGQRDNDLFAQGQFAMTQSDPQPPEREFSAGTITAAIWRNEREHDGRTVVRYSIRLRKQYYDESTRGFRDSQYFFADELPRVQLVVSKAYEYITLKQSGTSGEDVGI